MKASILHSFLGGIRFMKTRALTAGALSLALAASLTACVNDDSSKDVSTDKSEEKIVLRMMHLWPEETSAQQNKLVKLIIEEYKAVEPNVTITTEVLENEQYKNKMQVLAASNKLPDIGLTWAAGYMEPYVKGNKFAALDDLLQGELNNAFLAGMPEAYASGGKSYALPLELNIVPVYYNKDIFAKYGLEPPRTLDELKHIIVTLKERDVTPITLGGKDAWTASFWYMYLADRYGGADLLDRSVASNSFTDPALIDAAKAIQELVNLKAFITGFNGLSNDEAKSKFESGRAAMYAMGTWEVPNYTTNPDKPQAFKDKIGFFKFPIVEGGKGELDNFVGGPGVALFVSENSTHKDAAKRFVSFFVQKWGEHSVVEAGVIPATKVDTAAVKLPQMFIDLLNELNSAKKVTLYLDVQMKPGAAQEHYNLVQALFGKEITPEEFARKQEEALRAGK